MMVWAVIKIVDAGGADKIVGCMVGPFKTEHAAMIYAEKAVRYSLGYEKWIVKELQPPSDL
jgi:hypothetical protein